MHKVIRIERTTNDTFLHKSFYLFFFENRIVGCYCLLFSFFSNAKALTVKKKKTRSTFPFFLLGNYDWCLHFRCGVVVHKNARILIAKPVGT